MTLTRNTAFTYVTASGVTFTPNAEGPLVGGFGSLPKRIAKKIVSGDLLVTTPHRAGGSYRARGDGGIYESINPKARLMSLEDWMFVDPRASVDEAAEVWTAIEAYYQPKG